MKLASNLGMYEDEWKEEDWLFMYGEVPVIIILWPAALALVSGKPCGFGSRALWYGKARRGTSQNSQMRHRASRGAGAPETKPGGVFGEGDGSRKTRDELTLPG